jgi:hypothetical protein
MRMAGKEAQHMFETLLHSNENPHCERFDEYIVHGPHSPIFVWREKKHNICLKHCFTAMKIHTVSGSMNTSSMDLIGTAG